MGNFSKSPATVLTANKNKGYVGIHIEQGVPVLDRDLNLLHDLLASAIRSLIAKWFGNSVIGSGFLVQPLNPPANNFSIGAGTAFLGGIEVTLAANMNYSDQPGVPALTVPNVDRTDMVFLDVAISEVNGAVDPDLTNSEDVGIQTSVRQKLTRTVRVAEGTTTVPAAAAGHVHLALARLSRKATVSLIQPQMVTDIRSQILPLDELTLLARAATKPVFISAPSINPTTGTSGSSVVLFGRNFDVGTLTVRFISSANQVFPAAVTARSNRQATVTVPVAAANNYQITVSNESGSDTSPTVFVITKAKETKEKEKEKETKEKEFETTIKGVKEKEEDTSFLASALIGALADAALEEMAQEDLELEDAGLEIGRPFISPDERPDVGGRVFNMKSKEDE